MGIIFKLGVFVALIVGVIFVYQVIATDIADHIAEYATLRAIGYSAGYLSGVVLRQAWCWRSSVTFRLSSRPWDCTPWANTKLNCFCT